MLTSTLTRPSTMTRPTAAGTLMTCDRKIYLVETVDIALLRNPKSRIITLEPISRRSKTRASHKVQALPSDPQASTREANTLFEERSPSPTLMIPRTFEDPPQSPVPSEISSTSALSISQLSSRFGINSPFVKSGKASDAQSSSSASTFEKSITAAVELAHSGSLPGDIIPIKITIDHTKPIKSLQGIIITLYRLARIDTHPVMPLGAYSKGKMPEYEDYYPKSRTGLSGLSLSSAGSSHVFRKDLAQTFAPLIIDPHTFTATINASVRVPDDAFPTISNVPGAMINFNYFLEVVIDLRGKLSGQDRLLPRLGRGNNISAQEHIAPLNWRERSLGGALQLENANFADTEQIRREKSVIPCVFEVILGTRDSRRKITKKAEGSEGQTILAPHICEIHEQPANISHEESLYIEEAPRAQEVDVSATGGSRIDSTGQCLTNRTSQYRPELPPQAEVEEELDEKAQIRRAEERLLPSAPPVETISSSLTQPLNMPSAPPFSAFPDEFSSDDAAAPVYERPLRTFMERDLPPDGNIRKPYDSGVDRPRNSFHDDSSRDDKQELERQRMLASASAPDDDAYEDGEGSSNYGHFAFPAPSAPVIDDDYERDQSVHSANSHFESSGFVLNRHDQEAEVLPQYQK